MTMEMAGFVTGGLTSFLAWRHDGMTARELNAS
jgi:hypothetical protein